MLITETMEMQITLMAEGQTVIFLINGHVQEEHQLHQILASISVEMDL